MATTTTTAGMALGNIPLSTMMVDKEAVVDIVSGEAEEILSGVQEIVDTAVSTAWKAGGSMAPTGLTSALLVAANEGKVYNMSDSGTTDSNFMEGSGKPYTAGTDIAVINTGTASSPVYKFNVLAVQDGSVVKSVNNISPVNGNVTIPNAGASTNGLMTSGQYTKLSGIASGAEVNQYAFSKIKVNDEPSTGDAASQTDTLQIIGGSHIGVTRSNKAVTIAFSGALVEGVKIGETSYGLSDGEIDITCGVVRNIVTDSGNVAATTGTSGTVFDIHGVSGISVTASGSSVIVDGSTLQSGINAIDGAVSGLKNFSKVTVLNSAGSVVTNGTITPVSNADESLGFKAGSNVTLSTSGKNIVIAASAPVKDVMISGSSLLSGTTAVIPVATSGALGVVKLVGQNGIGDGVADAAVSAAGVSGLARTLRGEIAEQVSGGTLHSNLVSRSLSNPTGTVSGNTIYALLAALHASDNTAES